jgi:hypothetical protein
MPHHAIVSDFRVGDFSIKARLNPRRITLLERLRQRRCDGKVISADAQGRPTQKSELRPA